jgi:hypothetical protein
MQVTIQVPDYILEPIKDRLSPELTGMLEAVALEAILGHLDLLLDSTITVTASRRQSSNRQCPAARKS